LILLVLAMTVMFVVGAITVDVGLWLSERGIAQQAADFAALGGARELVGDLSDTTAAFDTAVDTATKNYVELEDIDGEPTSSCSTGKSCIAVGSRNCREEGSDEMPWVEAKIRRPGVALFSGIFGTLDLDIGATARAIRSPKRLSRHGRQSRNRRPVPERCR
jgi:uncharacterized membrane protein